MKSYIHDLLHFFLLDEAVAINIYADGSEMHGHQRADSRVRTVHGEGPFELLLWILLGRDRDGQQKFTKV